MPYWISLCLLGLLVGLTEGRVAERDIDVPTQVDERYSIELRVYVDKSAYLKWNTVLNKTLDAGVNRTIQVQDIIKSHIRAIMKGVNNIYSGLAEHGIHLDIRIASIHFVMDEVLNETEEGSGEVNNKEVVDRLASWLEERSDQGPAADHTMLFTGLNITGNSSDADSLGVARLGGMCDEQSSLSVVELLPPGGITTLVVAHELGHSLNASHDGEGNMTCSNDSYVMDARVNNNSTNSYIFSSCSVESIQEFLHHLLRGPTGSCLSVDNTTEVSDRTALTLGSLMTLDELCHMKFGPQAFFHRASYGNNASQAGFSTVCTSVWCDTSENHTSTAISADGFVCGNNKVCRLGLCVESVDVIDVPDGCPWGDAPAHANLHENVSCPDLAVSGTNASLCYSPYFRDSCCSSCASAYQNVTDCEYGDKAVWCITSEYPDVCHANDKVCCASCRPYFNESRVGCEYGDKAKWCATLEYPRDCYNKDATCCESCLQYYNASRQDCEYGDKEEWCTTLELPRQCYKNDHICCASCPPLRNDSNVDCEYGDKATWCADGEYPYVCDLNAHICCHSCRPFYNASRTGCEYGDKAKWCATLEYPRGCYNNDATCCESCLQYHNASRQGCEYGDKASGCEALTLPQACYKNAHLCCLTCLPFYQPSATGCEYGDKASWCAEAVAKDPHVCRLNSEVCCASCAPPHDNTKPFPDGETGHHPDNHRDEL